MTIRYHAEGVTVTFRSREGVCNREILPHHIFVVAMKPFQWMNYGEGL